MPGCASTRPLRPCSTGSTLRSGSSSRSTTSTASSSRGADSLDTVAAYIGMLMMDFTVESPPELLPRLQLLSERYARAVARS